jgi:hypothetical protein
VDSYVQAFSTVTATNHGLQSPGSLYFRASSASVSIRV